MVDVGVAGIALVLVVTAPPALGQGVLLVHAVHAARASPEVVGDVAVHVPHLALVLGPAVGRCKVNPQTPVAESRVLLHQFMDGVFQRLSALAVQRAVVARGDAGGGTQAGHGQHGSSGDSV